MKVLVARRIFPEVVEALRKRFYVEHNEDDQPWPTAELARGAAAAHALLTTVMEKVDASVEVLVANLGTQPRRVDVPQDQILASAEALICYPDVLVGCRAVDEALRRKGIGFVNARPQS